MIYRRSNRSLTWYLAQTPLTSKERSGRSERLMPDYPQQKGCVKRVTNRFIEVNPENGPSGHTLPACYGLKRMQMAFSDSVEEEKGRIWKHEIRRQWTLICDFVTLLTWFYDLCQTIPTDALISVANRELLISTLLQSIRKGKSVYEGRGKRSGKSNATTPI